MNLPANESPKQLLQTPNAVRLIDVDYADARPVEWSQRREPGSELKQIAFAFLRRLPLFGAISALVLAAFVLGPLRATPTYTASARLEIDPRKKEIAPIKQVESDLDATSVNVVDTEVEVLKSRHLADRVVDQLHLDRDPQFTAADATHGWVGELVSEFKTLLASARGSAPPTPLTVQQRRERVVDAVHGQLSVRRSGLTYVIDVAYASPNRGLAARVANAFADLYLTDQLDSKVDANRAANAVLNQRVSQLGAEVKQADEAVTQYKISHNLLSAGSETLTQQEISNLNTQMAQARAAEAESEAQVRTARAQLAAGSNGSDVSGALTSPVIASLRAQRAAINTRLAELSQKYGQMHPELLKAKHQLAEIDLDIQQEVNRTLSGLQAQAQIARERTASLQATLNNTRGALASNNRTSVELNDLQRNVDAERSLYEAFLARAKQTGVEQGLEGSDARILSRAKTPTHPSAPNIPILLLLAFASAAGLGLAGVAIVEKLDSSLATGSDVEQRLDIAYVGAIPTLSSVLDGDAHRPRKNSLGAHWRQIGLPMANSPNPIDFVVDNPLSAFSEAFRILRTTARYARVQAGGGQVLALTSALPGEGKTTTAICLGRLAAQTGERTLIIDCDIRRGGLTKALGLKTETGLLDVLNGAATLDEALLPDRRTCADILPAAPIASADKLTFCTPAMEALLMDLRRRYALIVLDAPPALAVADTRDLAARADGVVMLARWRRTPQKAVEAALQMIARVDAHLVGLALTQVDMRMQARFGYGDSGHFYGRYRKYYTT